MKKTAILFYIACTVMLPGYAQREEADSSKNMEEVTVRSFEQNSRRSDSRISVMIIERNNADLTNKSSLVNGFNTVAGVRMEERSPGSYRINIRGSSLRSPFGVRNVKVYWNDIPVTDPGGNTYFNQFAFNNFSYIEIFKGPAGSLYGAGTGGLILMHNLDRWQPGAGFEYVTGSYSLQNLFASARFGNKENRNQFTFAHNQSDGYRVQSSMRRDNLSWISQLKVSDKQQLTASVLFTDMFYQTPGALTFSEYVSDPKAARPAGGGFPAAVNAHAAIYQKTLTAGFTSTYQVSKVFRNTTTLYGAFAHIKNPAIRNFERRIEPGFGGRSVFSWNKKTGESAWQLVGGSEFQQGYFNTRVSKNKNGNPDTLLTNDDINYTVYSFFVQGDLSIRENWFINGGVSLNKTGVRISRLSVYPVVPLRRNYRNEAAPRISLKKKWKDNFSLMAGLSRGFSPPTIAELLPSTGVISTGLEAEYGWNYEMTANYSLFKHKLQLELTGFIFKLNQALVQRRDASGADYFVNAGDIREKGIEAHADYRCSPVRGRVIDYITLQTDLTLNHFRYGTFIKGPDNFSGKAVPAVPGRTFSFLGNLTLKNGCYLLLTYYAASRIYLNDANSASAPAYQVTGARLGWKKSFPGKYRLTVYTGADNLFNERYSLGNDINAAGGRYYNAAPGRNFYAGVSLQWIHPTEK